MIIYPASSGVWPDGTATDNLGVAAGCHSGPAGPQTIAESAMTAPPSVPPPDPTPPACAADGRRWPDGALPGRADGTGAAADGVTADGVTADGAAAGGFPDGMALDTAFDMALFDLTPVSLWLEDYSGVRRRMERWAAEGMTDVRRWLEDDPARVLQLSAEITVVRINRRALALYGARDLDELRAHFSQIFSAASIPALISEFEALWSGARTLTSFSINRTLDGRQVDIALDGVLLPGAEHDWSRVLFAIRDITARQQAIAALARSEARARALFAHSPVAMMLLNLGAVRDRLVRLTQDGIADVGRYLEDNPQVLLEVLADIRVLDANEALLTLFGISDLATLRGSLPRFFSAESLPPLRAHIAALWNGDHLLGEVEGHNVAADGREIWAQIRVRNLTDDASDWSEMLVALNDITARKQAESYLAYLSYHDVLTGLHNRFFHLETVERLRRQGPWPVTVLMIDLNDLKGVNDRFGHTAGDALLRRAAQVLTATILPPGMVSRIGGDEFAVLLPGLDEAAAGTLIAALETAAGTLLPEPDQPPLRFSIGAATAGRGQLAAALEQADARMYEAKRHYYRTHDRRHRADEGQAGD